MKLLVKECIYHYSVISKTQEIYPNAVHIRRVGFNHPSEVKMFWLLYEQALSRVEANCIPSAGELSSFAAWAVDPWEQVGVQAASLSSPLLRLCNL